MKILKLNNRVLLALSCLCFSIVACDKDDPQIRFKEYSLTAVGNSAVTGKVRFSENADKSFNILVSLNKSVKDTVHLVRLHNGSVANPGSVALSLANLTGTGAAASSETRNIKQVKLPNNSMKNVTYDSILNYNAYLNVYYSATKSDSLITQGNVGKNVN